jgi:MFS transporter, SHS family, lactate transporter
MVSHIDLAMRPLGALLFGALADRFGRKKPLIACVICFSSITLLSGFAANYLVFFVARSLYGIGMGSSWQCVRMILCLKN